MVSPLSDERLARVEGILEEVRTRLNHLEARITSLEERLEGRILSLEQRLEGRIGSLEGQMGSLEARLQTQFYWVLGILITMWVTIMMGIFGTLAAILFR